VKQFRNRCIFTHPFDMDFSAPLSMALFFQACISEMAALICMCDIPVKVTVYLEAGLFRADRAMSPRRARPTAIAVPLVGKPIYILRVLAYRLAKRFSFDADP